MMQSLLAAADCSLVPQVLGRKTPKKPSVGCKRVATFLEATAPLYIEMQLPGITSKGAWSGVELQLRWFGQVQ